MSDEVVLRISDGSPKLMEPVTLQELGYSVCKFQSVTSSEKRSGEESPACCEK